MRTNSFFWRWRWLIFLAFWAGFLTGLRLLFLSSPQHSGSQPMEKEEVIPTPSSDRSLPSERGYPQAPQQIIRQVVGDYPLIRHLPHDEPLFYANYLGPRRLGIWVKGEKEEAEKAVAAWLRRINFNPLAAGHELVWLSWKETR